MSNLDELVKELCPNGVKHIPLSDATEMKRGNAITQKDIIPGSIPVVAGGQKPAYFCDRANRDRDIITVAGSGAYAGYLSYWDCPIFVSDAFSVKAKENSLTKYIYYAMQSIQEKIYSSKKGGGVPHVHISSIDKFRIPLPPLAVQQEIVRILDSFTELTAELTARRKQYEYYRDQLLGMPPNGVLMTLGEIADYRRGSFPQPYGNAEWYGGEGAMPFVQVADVEEYGMILREETKQHISKVAQPKSVFVPSGTVICSIQGSIGRVAITQYDSYVDRTLAIFEKYKVNINKRYFAYQIQRKFGIEKEFARGSTLKTITKEEFTKFEIPVPPIEEQERIVSILDRFDTLCNDLTSGLPAEIQARQKQYEYYRDKLLTFEQQKGDI